MKLVVLAVFVIGCGGSNRAGDDDVDAGHDAPAGFVLSPYKDTSINFDWNLDVISTSVSGTRTPIADDLAVAGASTITLAFATGECGAESWGGLPGETMASVNVPMLEEAGVDFILATGGAAGSFTCGSDAGFDAFLARWQSSHLIGVDFDIEAGQSVDQIAALVARAASHPDLRVSFTIATLANTEPGESLDATGVTTVTALHDAFPTWPANVVVNLMTMDYGGGSPSICAVGDDARCDMGDSAVQAAQNLVAQHDVPLASIELTPMIGGNDVQANVFHLDDVDTVMTFALANDLAGVHWWSHDRDVDCAPGSASPTCNSVGDAGTRGYLVRFLGAL